MYMIILLKFIRISKLCNKWGLVWKGDEVAKPTFVLNEFPKTGR